MEETRMKRTIMLIGAGLLLVTFLGVVVSCHGAGPGFGMGRHHQELKEFMLYRLDKELNLTPEQKTLIEKSLEEVQQKAQALHSDYAQHLSDVKALILDPSLTEDKVNNLIDAQHGKMLELKDLVVKKLVQIQNALTPEQRTKLVKVLEGLKDKGPMGHGMMGFGLKDDGSKGNGSKN